MDPPGSEFAFVEDELTQSQSQSQYDPYGSEYVGLSQAQSQVDAAAATQAAQSQSQAADGGDREPVRNVQAHAISTVPEVSSGLDFNDELLDEEFLDEQKPVEKAPWACRYCGISEPSSVVRCIESGWWFCNSCGGTSASHIVQHLVRSKNKEICLHADGPLGETVVECYNCGIRNVFMMGFIPAKGESVVVLLCRNCLGINALKELGWNMDSWTPLVQDRQLVSWLVKQPDEQHQLRARQITTAQINKLEELWKDNPDAELEDLDKPGVDDEPVSVQLRYEDGYHYQNIFGPLVKLEADYDREMKENMREDNVSLTWERRELSGRMRAQLHFSVGQTEALRLTVGDELNLKLSKMLCVPTRVKDFEQKGTIVHIDDDGLVTIELRASSHVPENVSDGYVVSFVWKSITFDRRSNCTDSYAR